MKKESLKLFCSLCAAAAPVLALFAEIKPDFLLQDHMVFCSGKPVTVSGYAEPDELVTVSFLDKKSEVKADGTGRFCAKFEPLPVIKTPFEVRIAGKKDTVVLKDVLSGLVFLAGGQSNMEVRLEEAMNPEQEAAAANYPAIREFKVQKDFDFVPCKTLNGKWTVVSPQTAPKVGAVSYFTARMLHQEMDGIPVGIINNSVSASPQEAWLPEESAKKFNTSRYSIYAKYKPVGKTEMLKKREALEKSVILNDPGNDGEKAGWHKPDFDDTAWKDIKIPGVLESVFGDKDGAYWFRKVVELPPECAGKDLELELGTVDDYDTTYFNGEVIGKTGMEVPAPYDYRRFYTIPGKLVKAGKNVLAVRCFDARCGGGLYDKKMNIKLQDKIVCNLHGIWKTTPENVMDGIPYPGELFEMICVHRMASALYNAMFAPLKGTAVNAILWYQGETNADDGQVFADMFKECIRIWRHELGDDNAQLPFLFVQLSAYRKAEADPNKCGYRPEARASQAQALAIPNVYMVPSLDLGDAKRIHPLNKQDVGRRLALWMLQDVFKLEKFNGASAYPQIVSATLADNGKSIVLKIKNAEGLKTTDGKAPHSFAVCGAPEEVKQKKETVKQSVYRFADAKIQGDTIIVSVPEALKSAPVTVRYGWMDNPEVNTVNGKGLPLLPGSFDVK